MCVAHQLRVTLDIPWIFSLHIFTCTECEYKGEATYLLGWYKGCQKVKDKNTDTGNNNNDNNNKERSQDSG